MKTPHEKGENDGRRHAQHSATLCVSVRGRPMRGKHRTSNFEHRTLNPIPIARQTTSKLDVGSWLFDVFGSWLLAPPLLPPYPALVSELIERVERSILLRH